MALTSQLILLEETARRHGGYGAVHKTAKTA
jgi:hypothetical protein